MARSSQAENKRRSGEEEKFSVPLLYSVHLLLNLIILRRISLRDLGFLKSYRLKSFFVTSSLPISVVQHKFHFQFLFLRFSTCSDQTYSLCWNLILKISTVETYNLTSIAFAFALERVHSTSSTHFLCFLPLT